MVKGLKPPKGNPGLPGRTGKVGSRPTKSGIKPKSKRKPGY